MELEYKRHEWDYRTLPNKMYELVHNNGDLNKKGTGYLTDAESEMITILNYLNFGEKTGITESMIAQIDMAIRDSESASLGEEDSIQRVEVQYVGMPVEEFVDAIVGTANIPIGVVYYQKEGMHPGYTVNTYAVNGNKQEKHFETLLDSRRYLSTMGFDVRMKDYSMDSTVIETWI